MGTTTETARVWMSVGSRHHYTVATELLAAGPRRVVLMQRSSTLVLGPEAGWPTEGAFFDAAWISIRGGAEWLHIASIGGIWRHVRRSTSRFPDVARAVHRLVVTDDGSVGLPGTGSRPIPIKNVDALPPHPDLKIDRQVRLLVADFGDQAEAVIVENLGEQQLTLRLGTTESTELFELVHDLWRQCPSLTQSDLSGLVSDTE